MDEKLVAALIAFIAAIIATSTGLYWNFRNAKAARKLPFLTKQLEYCFEASEMTARLAVCEDEVIWKAARKRFFELFFGPLAIVEDDDVARAMMRFAIALDNGSESFPPSSKLNGPALDLSAQIRKLLLQSWEIRELERVLSPESQK